MLRELNMNFMQFFQSRKWKTGHLKLLGLETLRLQTRGYGVDASRYIIGMDF